jgi:hypothetical protein
MYQWLDATNVIASHTRARKKCQKMTGKWLLNGEQFRHWSRSPNSFLWIYGIREFPPQTLLELQSNDEIHSWLR